MKVLYLNDRALAALEATGLAETVEPVSDLHRIHVPDQVYDLLLDKRLPRETFSATILRLASQGELK